jgi:AmmeMemoRadiSam system protein A
MSEPSLSQSEKECLLKLARRTITILASGGSLPPVCLEDLPARLRQPGASFVTLTEYGDLRGCVGTLEAYQSLAEDVCEHAEAAAFHDYRFPPVRIVEVPQLKIEISCLTEPQLLEYSNAEDLMVKLRPGLDGVMLRDGYQRATFLPQVWEKLPDPAVFLDHLCEKMGSIATAWRRRQLQVFTYQVESFEEEEDRSEEEKALL